MTQEKNEHYAPVRKKTRPIHIGSVSVGGDNPVRIQSMTNTDTRDVEATVEQIHALENAGCEIVRVAVLDKKAAEAIEAIQQEVAIPLIADIHFDHRLALAAIEQGVDGLRINPGNIGGKEKVDRVISAAKQNNVPIRIGVNSGSLEKDLLKQFQGPTPEAMVESALRHVLLLEKRGFDQIKISLKSSSVLHTIAAYRLLSRRVDYPLHIGITEAGTVLRGAVKSAVGLGVLLWEGLGDTLRVSLTADPVKEVFVAWEILRSLGLGARGPEIVSCPTCGRTEVDLIELAEAVEERIGHIDDTFTVAVMGCVVNGPGEAKEADIGIAGGRECGLIFRKGEIIRKIKGTDNLIPEFMREIEAFLQERNIK